MGVSGATLANGLNKASNSLVGNANLIERLWRSVKYEEVHIKDYSDVREAKEGIESYFKFYNNERPHQSLGYNTPYEVYYGL